MAQRAVVRRHVDVADSHLVERIDRAQRGFIRVVNYEDAAPRRNPGDLLQSAAVRTSVQFDDFGKIVYSFFGAFETVFVQNKECVGFQDLSVFGVAEVVVGKRYILSEDLFQITVDKLNGIFVVTVAIDDDYVFHNASPCRSHIFFCFNGKQKRIYYQYNISFEKIQ